MSEGPWTVGIVGLGNIGTEVARRLAAGAVPEARLVAVCSRDPGAVRDRLPDLGADVAVRPFAALAEVAGRCDIVVESAVASVFGEVARRVLDAGRVLVPVSISALAYTEGLEALCHARGGRMAIPSGGMVGLDAIRAAAEDGVSRALVRMRITPDSLKNEAYVKERGIALDTGAPVEVFSGTVREAAKALPNHCNNPVALALASGRGIDGTEVEVVAEDGLPGARVEVEVDAEAVTLRFSSQNLPSAASPRTSRIIAPSVVAAIRGVAAPVRVGS